MAILKQGSIGIFTGKIGALVISKWKDKYVGKSKSKTSAKKATVLQLTQQSKIRLAGKFMRMFQTVVPFSFQKPPKNMTAMNYAMWYNLKHSINGVYPDFTINYAQVKLSQPADYATEIDNGFNIMAVASGPKITISWEADDMPENEETKPTDRAYTFFYHAKKNVSAAPPTRQRSELGFDIDLPQIFYGGLHVWVFFAADDCKFVSETQYLGEFNVG